VKSLLYFADYSQEEYEPVHDENMLVYSYGEVDRSAAPDEASSAAFDLFADDFLYLGHQHAEPVRHVLGGAAVLFGSLATAVRCCESILQPKELPRTGMVERFLLPFSEATNWPSSAHFILATI
jgi:hypothetical protein